MEIDELYRLLRVAHVQLQGIVDTIRDSLLVVDGHLVVVNANTGFYRTFQTDAEATIGRSFLDLCDGQWTSEDLRFLLERIIPKGTIMLNYEVVVDVPDQGQRHMDISAQRLVHPDDGRPLILISMVDATERKRRAGQQDLLLNEIRHRIKNLLAVTQALAKQTSTQGRSAEEYRDAFLGRFGALSRAMDLSGSSKESTLPDLAEAILSLYRGDGHVINIGPGPVVPLSPRQAMSMGMVLHELGTNALKYGALSNDVGRVDITWSIARDGKKRKVVHMTWKETAGTAVVTPEHTGFGTRLIKSAVQRDLGGKVELDFAPKGLTVQISFPIG